MCGFVGIANYKKNLTNEKNILKKSNQTLSGF